MTDDLSLFITNKINPPLPPSTPVFLLVELIVHFSIYRYKVVFSSCLFVFMYNKNLWTPDRFAFNFDLGNSVEPR